MDISKLAWLLKQRGYRIAVAESCTGGLLSTAFTASPGSSNHFECGWVTYSNDSKHTCLGVQQTTLDQHGAVSEATVHEMVEGIFNNAPVELAIAISGIAGPDGGSPEKPVGTVFIGYGRHTHADNQAPVIEVIRYQFDGKRDDIMQQTVDKAIAHLYDSIQ